MPNPFAELGAALSRPAPAPGLVLQPTADHFDDLVRSDEVAAARLGAHTAWRHGLGHWWPLQNPAAGAAALRTFWSMIGP